MKVAHPLHTCERAWGGSASSIAQLIYIFMYVSWVCVCVFSPVRSFPSPAAQPPPPTASSASQVVEILPLGGLQKWQNFAKLLCRITGNSNFAKLPLSSHLTFCIISRSHNRRREKRRIRILRVLWVNLNTAFVSHTWSVVWLSSKGFCFQSKGMFFSGTAEVFLKFSRERSMTIRHRELPAGQEVH